MAENNLHDEIAALKEQRNAVILAHNYQLPEVQDIADYTGDSLGLSRLAADSTAEVIVFCGVYFMAETAAILSPGKTVLIPDRNAGCGMVDMTPVENVRRLKAAHPGAVVVSYVNSSAAVKAESDYCCTSANAAAVVAAIDPSREIIFVPDRNLGAYVAACCGREMIFYDGCCPVHRRIRPGDVRRLKDEHPDAAVVVHPECDPAVIELADRVLSTGGMLREASASAAKEFIVGTELGMVYRLRKDNPGKRFYIISEAAVCPDMKFIDLPKLRDSLEHLQFAVTLPEDIRAAAETAVRRMVSLG